MATNDLLSELQKDSIKLDDEAEKKVVKTLLALLKDNNAEVQNLAVKWYVFLSSLNYLYWLKFLFLFDSHSLGPLITKVKEAQVDSIVETLCSNMLSQDEILKETSSIGLKTVISEIPIDAHNFISAVCKKITGRLINAVMQPNVSVQLEALEIFSDLLFRFGKVMSLYYPSVKDALLPQLKNSRTAVCKRTITCVAYMTITSSDALYAEIMTHLLSELTDSEPSNSKIYINCATAICKHSSSRMGIYLEEIMELIMKYIEHNDDDLKEACFQAFEIFVRRCPKEVSGYIEKVFYFSITTFMFFIIFSPS